MLQLYKSKFLKHDFLQIDKMVGGFPGKVKGRYPPGTLHRPCSVGDFNDVEDESWNIDQMSDQEVASEFEKMLENMNLSEVKNEEIKVL